MSRPIEVKCATDNTSFKVDTKLISRSKFLEDLCNEYASENVIEIPDIKGSTMKLIVEWLEHHKDTEPKLPPVPLRTYNLAETIGEWEDKFMETVFNNNFNNLFEFLSAANFLDIPPLLELASAKTACLTKDLTPKEFKELFKIEEDCTEDDIRKIEEEVLKEREEEKEKERKRIEEEENNNNNNNNKEKK